MRIIRLASAIRSVRPRPPRTPQTLRTSATPLVLDHATFCTPRSFTISVSRLGSDKSNKTDKMAPKIELKTPKGTRDWDGKNMLLREQIFDTSELRASPGTCFRGLTYTNEAVN